MYNLSQEELRAYIPDMKIREDKVSECSKKEHLLRIVPGTGKLVMYPIWACDCGARVAQAS